MSAGRTVCLDTVRSTRRGGSTQVQALVGGTSLWFETSDCALTPSVEAFASAILYPALHQKARIEARQPADAVWMDNVRHLIQTWQLWWGCKPLFPSTNGVNEVRPGNADGTALCFTGGVDSFHTLLHGQHAPQMLVFVHGYDVPLDDTSRAHECICSVRAIAQAQGIDSVVIRTNFREHPLGCSAPWERAHGGAVAAIGHLLGGVAGRLIISGSFPKSYPYYWGTHWQTDPLWSSSQLQVIHEGADCSRIAKVRQIARDPLVQAHLHVCWENWTPAGNCSCCDKCVCTMVAMETCGARMCFPGFDQGARLPECLDRLPRTRFLLTYSELLDNGLDQDIAAAVRRLLKRSKATGVKRWWMACQRALCRGRRAAAAA